MMIEYYASDSQDQFLERAFARYHIKEWFNPQGCHYVLETDDPRVISTLDLLEIAWREVGATSQ